MTATDILRLPNHVQLPMLASDSRVKVVTFTEPTELDSCEVCIHRNYQENRPDTTPIPVGTMRVSWRFSPGRPEHHTDVCGCDDADVELEDLLLNIGAVEVTLRVPAPRYSPAPRPHGLAETPLDPEADPLFLIYDALIRLIKNIPNTATVDMSGRDGFLHAQHALMALFAARGINRAEQLRRDVA